MARQQQQEDTFESFVSRERERLNQAREDAMNRRQEIENELSDIERELQAISAYELAKQGRLNLDGANKRHQSSGNRRPREGGRRDQILQLLRDAGDGLTRGDIIDRLGVKGDKGQEQSISNALSALKKQNAVGAKGGRYTAA